MLLPSYENERKIDIIESSIGNFGVWQCRISICMALLKFPIAWFQLGIVFIAPPTEHWCRQPEDFKLMAHHQWIDEITPHGNETNYLEHHPMCAMKNVELPGDSKLIQCRWGYEYNRTVIHSSVITEWNLVCDKEHLVNLAQMILMLGVLLGNLLFGTLADRYGRKRILIVCIVMQSSCGILSAWAPWYDAYLTLRFLMALANGGTMITSFVICMEVVGGRWRSIVPILYQIPFGVGISLMSGIAYYCRDWRQFQLTVSILSCVYVIYIWAVPESPRWLLATGRRTEAARILEKAAYTNQSDISKIRSAFLTLPKSEQHAQQLRPRLGELLKTRTIRQRTLILSINWLMSGITFYGFAQYLGQIGRSVYVNVAVGGAIIIPGTVLCMLLIQRCGRRWTISVANMFITSCFITIIFIPRNVFEHDWPRIVMAAFGLIGLSISTPTLYLFTGELYPTVLRNMGMGVGLMASRIGAIAAPFIVSLESKQRSYLPLVIFSCLALLQSVLILPLPESNAQLPDTIDDIEMSAFANEDLCNGNYVAVNGEQRPTTQND